MSNWITRLPYAHRYITKTLFEGAEADLELPERIISGDTGYWARRWQAREPFPMYSRRSTTVHLELLKRYYYEVSVPLGVRGGKSDRLSIIGYEGSLDAIRYADNGRIFMDTLQDLDHVAITYGAGDIIGCGYESPSRFFFTKNGIYLGHCIAHLGLNALCPEILGFPAIGGDFYEPMNLGQRPFMFDIEGYFDERYARLRRLAADLPLDILENVLQCALMSQGIGHILHLSRVCRRWHTLTFRSVIDLSIVTRKDLADLLTILRTRTPIDARSVNTQESPYEAWLHRFLVSPLPYIRSTSTLSIQTLIQHKRSPWDTPPSKQRQRFLGKAPSFLSQSIPGLLHHTFTEVHTLKLSGYSFSTWTRFAQVVFALERLETLVCSSVTWDSSPTTPPTWLSFLKRLRHASFRNMGGCILVAGAWWLFLAGRPRQPSDDLVLIPSDISVIGQLASLIHPWDYPLPRDFAPPRDNILPQDETLPRNYTITYDQKQDQSQSCSLSLMIENQLSAAPDLFFQFERNGVTYYQVRRIDARLAWETPTPPNYSTLQEVGRCCTALSSANLCHFRFDFSGLARSEGALYRRRVAKEMMQQHSAGLLECTWNGEAIEDTEGVQWLEAGAVVTFGVEKTYKRGTSGKITWDVDGLRPHLSGPSSPHLFGPSWPDYVITTIIHWVKLYKHDNQSFGSLIADVAFDIDFLDGQAEFLLPEVDPGLYFLAVGDYIYCTQSFQVIQ